MQAIVKLFIFVHVSAGIGSLISGAFAMYFKSNTPKHRIAGKVYFWNMTVIFITGLSLSLYRKSLFFVFISFFVYHALVSAYRALKLKNLHRGQSPERIDWAIEIVAGTANASFVLFAVYWYFNGMGFNALIPLVFGLIGLQIVRQNVSLFLKKTNDATHWLQRHISGMIGSYIGGITAFLVNQSAHIPINPVVLWLAPTVIFTPFIVFEIRKVKAKVE